jgi:hypothetical protein
MCLTHNERDRMKGAYYGPYKLREEMLEGLRCGDLSITSTIVARLFSVASACSICLEEELDDSMVTQCGHQFCKEVLF